MPDLSSPETCIKPYENRPHRLIKTPFLPTLKPEEPLVMVAFQDAPGPEPIWHWHALHALVIYVLLYPLSIVFSSKERPLRTRFMWTFSPLLGVLWFVAALLYAYRPA